jgi:hypothetical protein
MWRPPLDAPSLAKRLEYCQFGCHTSPERFTHDVASFGARKNAAGVKQRTFDRAHTKTVDLDASVNVEIRHANLAKSSCDRIHASSSTDLDRDA